MPDPKNISSYLELLNLANNITNGKDTCSGYSSIKLTNDIYCCGEWPVCGLDNAGKKLECPVFDGNGHSIIGLRQVVGVVSGTLFGTSYSMYRFGMFGDMYINDNTVQTIKNLTIRDAVFDITVDNANYCVVGSILGHCGNLRLENCTIRGTIRVNVVNAKCVYIGGAIESLWDNCLMSNCDIETKIVVRCGNINITQCWVCGGICEYYNNSFTSTGSSHKIYSNGITGSIVKSNIFIESNAQNHVIYGGITKQYRNKTSGHSVDDSIISTSITYNKTHTPIQRQSITVGIVCPNVNFTDNNVYCYDIHTDINTSYNSGTSTFTNYATTDYYQLLPDIESLSKSNQPNHLTKSSIITDEINVGDGSELCKCVIDDVYIDTIAAKKVVFTKDANINSTGIKEFIADSVNAETFCSKNLFHSYYIGSNLKNIIGDYINVDSTQSHWATTFYLCEGYFNFVVNGNPTKCNFMGCSSYRSIVIWFMEPYQSTTEFYINEYTGNNYVEMYFTNNVSSNATKRTIETITGTGCYVDKNNTSTVRGIAVGGFNASNITKRKLYYNGDTKLTNITLIFDFVYYSS